MQDRIDKLENLVLSLMSSGNNSSSQVDSSQNLMMDTSPFQDSPLQSTQSTQSVRDEDADCSETDGVAKSLGVLHMQNDKSMYMGEGHWATVLKDVCREAVSGLVLAR